MSKFNKVAKVITIFPALWEAGVWVADRIRARRKRRFTAEERERAARDARAHAERIAKDWKRGK